jgi:hypothetical protein
MADIDLLAFSGSKSQGHIDCGLGDLPPLLLVIG